MFIKGAALQGFAWKSHCRLLQHEQMWIGAERDVVKNEKGSFQIKCKGKKHNTYCHFPLKFCSHSELTFFFFFFKVCLRGIWLGSSAMWTERIVSVCFSGAAHHKYPYDRSWQSVLWSVSSRLLEAATRTLRP